MTKLLPSLQQRRGVAGGVGGVKKECHGDLEGQGWKIVFVESISNINNQRVASQPSLNGGKTWSCHQYSINPLKRKKNSLHLTHLGNIPVTLDTLDPWATLSETREFIGWLTQQIKVKSRLQFNPTIVWLQAHTFQPPDPDCLGRQRPDHMWVTVHTAFTNPSCRSRSQSVTAVWRATTACPLHQWTWE